MLKTSSCVAAKWYSCPPPARAMIVWLRLRAASWGMETKPVFDSDKQLLAVLEMLEECRSALAASGNRDTAHLVSVAALDVSMKLNRIGDAELKLLCDAMVAKELAGDWESETSPSRMPGERPLLRVVK